MDIFYSDGIDIHRNVDRVEGDSSKIEVGFDHESFNLISLWLANPTRRKEEGYDFDVPSFVDGLSAIEVKAYLIKMQLALHGYAGCEDLSIYWSHPTIQMTLDEVFLRKIYKRLADRLVLWDALLGTEYRKVMLQLHRLYDQLAYFICGLEAPRNPQGHINVAMLVHGKAYTLLQDIWKYL